MWDRKQYDHERYLLEKNIPGYRERKARHQQKYRRGNRVYSVQNIQNYAKNNPEKYKAGRILRLAVQRGKISKPNHCTRCGLVCNPEGHHADYGKPLEVIWLCRPCHRAEDGRVMRVES